MPVGRWDRWQPGAAFFNHHDKEVVIYFRNNVQKTQQIEKYREIVDDRIGRKL